MNLASLVFFTIGCSLNTAFSYPPFDNFSKFYLLLGLTFYILGNRIYLGAIFVICSFVVFSSVYSLFSFYGSDQVFKNLLNQIVFFLGSLGVANFISTVGDRPLRFLVWGIVAGCVVPFSMILLVPFSDYNFSFGASSLNGLYSAVLDYNPTPTYKHLHSAYMVLVVLSVVALTAFYQEGKGSAKVVLFILIFAAIISRTLGVAVFIALIFSHLKRPWVKGFLLFTIYFCLINYVAFAFDMNPEEPRIQIWRGVLSSFYNGNFFGVGPFAAHDLLKSGSSVDVFLLGLSQSGLLGFESGVVWAICDLGLFAVTGLIIINILIFSNCDARLSLPGFPSFHFDGYSLIYGLAALSNHLFQPYFWLLLGFYFGIVRRGRIQSTQLSG